MWIRLSFPPSRPPSRLYRTNMSSDPTRACLSSGLPAAEKRSRRTHEQRRGFPFPSSPRGERKSPPRQASQRGLLHRFNTDGLIASARVQRQISKTTDGNHVRRSERAWYHGVLHVLRVHTCFPLLKHILPSESQPRFGSLFQWRKEAANLSPTELSSWNRQPTIGLSYRSGVGRGWLQNRCQPHHK